MRTGLTGRTAIGGCDNIHEYKGLVFPCGKSRDYQTCWIGLSRGKSRESSSSTTRGYDLIQHTAHFPPLHIPKDVERWSDLPPNCGESHNFHFQRIPEIPRSPAVRPGSALRPWSGRAKKGELCDYFRSNNLAKRVLMR